MGSEWLDVEVAFVKKKAKGIFRRRKLNFMAIHYIYITCWAIAGSILLFPAGGIAYVDALFFGAGAATQSGLNTVDVNQLRTYQQIILYILPMFTNPIVIHGAVVFVRLYWFEKRFQNVVREAMHFRHTRTRSPTRELDRTQTAPARENGVRGKNIVVLKDGHPIGSPEMHEFKEKYDSNGAAIDPSGSSTNSKKDDDDARSQRSQVPPLASDRFKREVLFADQVMASPTAMSPTTRFPEPRSPDHHIAFLERQRNPEDKGALRIPGPRDFDRGKLPERVSTEEERNDLNKTDSRPLSANEGDMERRHSDHTPRPPTDKGFKRNITIDDSARPTHLRPVRTNQSRVTFRRSDTTGSNAILEEEDDPVPPRPRPRARSNTFSSFLRTTSTQHDPGPVPYLSWQPTVGRNSAFIDLTEEQREELGGIEYRSLKTLAVVIISYFFFWHLLGIVILMPWINLTQPWAGIVDSVGVSRPWWGLFSSATLFNDVGFTLTPDSFISFQLAVVPLLLGSLLIIVGNTGFPCMLRLWLWILQKVVPQDSSLWEELRFLLDHPRRCFTLLFPAAATWVLFAILILLNAIDLIFFIILDINDPVVESLPPGFRFLAGLFQAASTRTAGTAVVNLAELHPGIQVSYLIMMYISVFPIAISMRRTNVYEERSLGVYSNVDEEEDPKEPSYIGAHLRKQLSFDLWFIFLGLFIIAIAEGGRISDPSQPSFDLFACLFEIVSAYGTVGLSLGYPNKNASFSSEFTVVSKLVIIAMMIRGRHRGLPYQLDRAVLLPSENLHRKEDEDARRRRRYSMSGTLPNVPTGTYSTAINYNHNNLLAPLTSRGSHKSSFLARPRDAVAKAAEGIEHAHQAVQAEIH